MEQYNPKLAFIYASCASGIIGDDIDAIASDLQQEYLDTIMVPIHCEGFKSKICASGFDAAFLSINKYILKKEKVPKEKGLVNLFAPTTVSFADPKEMERMLSQIGIQVNYIPFYSSLEKIKKIPAAEASTSICKVFADEFMKTLWEDYEIPYSHTVMPIGIRNTDKIPTTHVLDGKRPTMGYDGLLVEKVIAAEEDYVYHYLAQSIGVVSWKRFAVVADASNAVGITRYLANDFSFTPVLVIISEPIFRQEDKDRIIAQISDLEYAVPPRIVFTADQYEINQVLLNEEKEITLLIGSSNEREVVLEKDIQFILASFPMNERLVFNRTYAGYRGGLTFTEDLYDNL